MKIGGFASWRPYLLDFVISARWTYHISPGGAVTGDQPGRCFVGGGGGRSALMPAIEAILVLGELHKWRNKHEEVAKTERSKIYSDSFHVKNVTAGSYGSYRRLVEIRWSTGSVLK